MKKKGLLQKFLSFSIGNWIVIIIGVFSTPLITRLISPDDFGKASMFTLIVSLLSLISFMGTDQSFTRFYYEHNDISQKSTLLYQCLKVSFITFGIIIVILSFFRYPFLIKIVGEYDTLLYFILLFTIFITILNRYVFLVIRMEQRGLLYSGLQVMSRILEVSFIITFVIFLTIDYKSMIYAQSLTIFLVTLTGFILSRKMWAIKRVDQSKNEDSVLSFKELIHYGFPLGVTGMIYWLFQTLDRFALNYWSTYEELGLYVAAFKIVALLNIIQTSFTTFWVPVSYQKYQENKEDKDFFSNFASLIMLLMIFIGLFVLISKDLIVYLLGPEYREAAKIMPFLIFMPIMYTLSEVTVVGINFAKKSYWHIIISIITLISNLIGNLILVPSLGAVGAAVSTGISYIVFLLMRTFISLRYYKVNYHLSNMMSSIIILLMYTFVLTFYSSIYDFLLGIVFTVLLLMLNFKLIKKSIENLEFIEIKKKLLRKISKEKKE